MAKRCVKIVKYGQELSYPFRQTILKAQLYHLLKSMLCIHTIYNLPRLIEHQAKSINGYFIFLGLNVAIYHFWNSLAASSFAIYAA
jgi:hypothetical protein